MSAQHPFELKRKKTCEQTVLSTVTGAVWTAGGPALPVRVSAVLDWDNSVSHHNFCPNCV